MAITRYTLRTPTFSPFRDLEEVSNRLAQMFEDPVFTRPSNGGTWVPAVNVEETNDEVILSAELPGMTQENISIELENNVLTISGEKTEERTEGAEDRRYHLWERRYGSFNRSFTLPRTVKADEIRANFEKGVLRVHMPKMEEAKGRRIAIQAG